MIIRILPLLFITSFFASAQTLKVVKKKPQTLKVIVKKQLQALENLGSPPICDTCENDETELYTPQEALNDINSGNLTYLGRDLFPGSGQNRTCVYKSDSAYILYDHCMANKREAEATDISVISFNGGITHFSILTNTAPISELPRSAYDITWTISSTPSPPPGKLTMNELKSFVERPDAGNCFVGSIFKSLDMSTKAHCSKIPSKAATNWSKSAEEFWREPGDEWYKTLKKLRKEVVETKF